MPLPEVDTSRTVEIKLAVAPLVFGVIVGCAMTLASLAIVVMPWLGSFVPSNGGTLARLAASLIALFGVIFFGLATVIIYRRLAGSPRWVLTISPAGLKDLRLSPTTIAWASIRELSRSGRFIVLKLDPAVDAALERTRAASVGKIINAPFGLQNYIGTRDLTVGSRDLYRILTAYHSAFAGAEVPQRPTQN